MSEILGVFGGTFSPPHEGHLHALQAFAEAARPDRILVIPTFLPPHKSVEEQVPAADRLAMCHLAFDGVPNVTVSDLELQRGGVSYTADTLSMLSADDRTLVMLCGTDMCLTLDRWHDPARIFALTDLYCVRREEDDTLAAALMEKNRQYRALFGKEVHLISAPAIPVSSTDIRAALRRGIAPATLPERVFTYIRERGLYQYGTERSGS